MTKSLNQSGAFLQIHVLDELSKYGWSTIPEYPVKVSPFIKDPRQHPLLRENLSTRGYVESTDFAQAVFESQNHFDSKETSIDVVARKKINDVSVVLCVESKKLNPDYIDWCFFQQKDKRFIMRVIAKSQAERHIARLFTVPPAEVYRQEIHLNLVDYPQWKPTQREVADFALALRDKKVDSDYYKTQKTIVDESCRQIIEGTYGYTIESLVNEIATANPFYSNYHSEIIIPVVVTNANLYLCDFNVDDIEPETGQIKVNPNYKKIESIVYECAAPKSVQFPELLAGNLRSEFKSYVTKWDVLILSPKGLNDLLKMLYKLEI